MRPRGQVNGDCRGAAQKEKACHQATAEERSWSALHTLTCQWFNVEHPVKNYRDNPESLHFSITAVGQLGRPERRVFGAGDPTVSLDLLVRSLAALRAADWDLGRIIG